MHKFKTYKAKRKIGVSKEKTFPVLARIVQMFVCLGSIFSFFISSFIIGIKEIFGIKKKIYEKDFFRGKYKEIRVRKDL